MTRQALILALLLLAGALSRDAGAAGGAAPTKEQASGLMLHVPIPVVPLADVYSTLHREYAATRTEDRDWVALGGGTGFLKYRLWPGDPTASIAGDRLLSHAVFPIGAEYGKRVNGSIMKLADCGRRDAADGTGQISLALTTSFALGRDYTVLPTSAVTAVDHKRPCTLSEQGVDAAPLVAQIYHSEVHKELPTWDRKAAARLTLKPTVTKIWRELQDPLLLDEKEGLWLLVQPEAVGPLGVQALAGSPAAGYGITIRPTLVRGAKPPTSSRPLPALQEHGAAETFHVRFDVQMPLEEANQRLREAVIGQEWSLGVGTVKIAGASLYPVGNQLGVELTLRGLLALTLRITGTPAYEESTGRVLFRRVDYTIKERTPATQLADEWLHEPLRAELARRLAVPIRPELEVMRQEMEKGLNREMASGRLRGSVRELDLKQWALQGTHLAVGFLVDGTLHYEVRAEHVVTDQAR